MSHIKNTTKDKHRLCSAVGVMLTETWDIKQPAVSKPAHIVDSPSKWQAVITALLCKLKTGRSLEKVSLRKFFPDTYLTEQWAQ